MTNSGNRDSRLLVDGHIKFDKFMLGAVWINRRVEADSPVTSGITSNQFVLEGE